MIKRIALTLLAALLLTHGPTQAGPVPESLTASDVLRALREGQANRHETLAGQLRNDADGKTFPFRMAANGPLVRYEFAGTPPTVVQVRYNEDNSQLEESTAGTTEKLTPSNFDKKILSTDLSFEDLALRFVYWTHATITGDDNIRTRDAWKLKLNAPTLHTEYSSVNLWVDKETQALLQAEAYDHQGKIIKRFEVISGQKIEGKWYLKQMRIESLDPASPDGRVLTRTYLEIKNVVR